MPRICARARTASNIPVIAVKIPASVGNIPVSPVTTDRILVSVWQHSYQFS